MNINIIVVARGPKWNQGPVVLHTLQAKIDIVPVQNKN